MDSRLLTSVVDFIDLDNAEHVQALKHLYDKGYWPLGFIDMERIFFPNGWCILLSETLAERWLKDH